MYSEVVAENVRPGHIIQYGEEHYVAVVALVRDVWTDEGFRKFGLFVLENIFGPYELGHTFEVGKRLNDKYSHYVSWRFKLPGEMTEYVVGDLDEQRNKLSEAERRWRTDEFFASHELEWIEVPDVEST